MGRKLDFCFIDENHSYKSVREDVLMWLPKIKKGGILAGHDYFHAEVRRAVHDALKDTPAKVNGRGRHGKDFRCVGTPFLA
jgi:hypothetical protein